MEGLDATLTDKVKKSNSLPVTEQMADARLLAEAIIAYLDGVTFPPGTELLAKVLLLVQGDLIALLMILNGIGYDEEGKRSVGD